MATIRSVVRGNGYYLPERVLTNQELAGMVDTSHEWILQRTGIEERHIAAEGETTSMLGLKAAERALADAGLEPKDIDLIVCATSTPDYTFPSTATQIQAGLGIHHGAAFDLQAVCTGFVYGVATADKFLTSGSHRRALVIGAETFSRILDWKDRTTCVLFGDGAGAIVLEAQLGEGTPQDRGVLTSHLRSDGAHRDKLYVDGGPGSTKTTGCLRMEGREVYRHAVSMVTDVIHDAFKTTRTTAEDIDWFVPHQANKRIIDATAEKLGIAPEKVVLTSHLRSDGAHRDKLYVDGGPGSTKTTGCLRMEGREVYRHAVSMVTDVIHDAFKTTRTTAEDIDWFVPHQANKRIIDATAEKLGIAPEKVVLTVNKHGNTSAASIPLALGEARADGRIKQGDLVMIEAMGGGFTWGAALIRW